MVIQENFPWKYIQLSVWGVGVMITVHLNKTWSLMQKLKYCFASSENWHWSIETRLILTLEKYCCPEVRYHSLRTRATKLSPLCFYLQLPVVVLYKGFYMKKDFQIFWFDCQNKIRLKTTLWKCNFRSLLLCSVSACWSPVMVCLLSAVLYQKVPHPRVTLFTK